jgi:hypothetical protein
MYKLWHSKTKGCDKDFFKEKRKFARGGNRSLGAPLATDRWLARPARYGAQGEVPLPMTIIEKDLERPLVYPTFLRFSILYKGDKTLYLANILANMLVLLPPWPHRTQPVVPLLRPSHTQARLRRMVCRPVMVAVGTTTPSSHVRTTEQINSVGTGSGDDTL